VLELDRETSSRCAVLPSRRSEWQVRDEVEWLVPAPERRPDEWGRRRSVGAAKGKAATAPLPPRSVYDAMTKPDFAVEHETPEPVELGKPSRPSTSAPEVSFENSISFNPSAQPPQKGRAGSP